MIKPINPVGPEDTPKPAPIAPRLAWFAGIAVISGGAVATLAYLLRGLLFL